MRDIWLLCVREGLAPYVVAFGLFMSIGIIVGLTPKKYQSLPIFGAFLRMSREISVVTHPDEPGTFTIPTLLKRLILAAVRAPKGRSPKQRGPSDGPHKPSDSDRVSPNDSR